ncbi:mycothiol transferase [Goodfellowiella coeruleoviolacea]|uniref:DUF664 domain-containing protein n=1 Tax=Goodfellowiella coeruleoviolacea TaxID=334858 RepID=A0AAE3GJS8_9PSEU|nr:DUF664 domain-containing protein [Goodfellowiella coeruleoviolacea]MCP2167458.1 Protein of unknown function (DUF664) [Goodfellowiella coeruleoviolacea]
MISRDQYCYYAGRALDGMIDIVARLGDDLANRTPAIPGANSPYALLNHCLGVVSYWSGQLVAGRSAPRDRDAEFTASGPVAPLLRRAREIGQQLQHDVAAAAPREPLRAQPRADFLGPARELDQGGALFHVYEELAQHHGQMEIIRDCILAGVPANG